MLETVRCERLVLGCRCELRLVGDDRVHLRAAGETALDEISRIDAWLSCFRHDSETSRINRADVGESLCIDHELNDLLAVCAAAWQTLDGAFDPVAGSRGEDGQPLTWADLEFDPSRRRLTKLANGVRLDFGGVGKGYALDRARRILLAAGVERALLNAGGSSQLALGSPENSAGWPIALPGLDLNWELANAALSTSATRHPTQKVSDVVTPQTGQPLEGERLVTVQAGTATLAEILSTALLVIPTDKHTQAIRSIEDPQVKIVLRQQQLPTSRSATPPPPSPRVVRR